MPTDYVVIIVSLLPLITFNDIKTVGRAPLNEGSASIRDLYLTLITLKRETSITPAEFEPKIPGSERPQAQASDRAATGIF